jgi:hypothetical protein
MQIRKFLNQAECSARFAMQYNNQPAGLGATRSALMRLLRSADLVSWSTHEESGRVDRRAFTRYATGSTAVFSRRQISEAETSAVSVLIDCSTSMSNMVSASHSRIDIAEEVGIQLAKLLDKAKVSYKISGFYGDGDYMSVNAAGASAGSESPVMIDLPVFVPFKQWNESIQKASAKLGSIRNWTVGCTPDYGALYVALTELARREEHRKVLFLITDASGYNQDHAKHLQAIADKQGIKLIAIGIGYTDVENCYKTSANVFKQDELASAAFGKLLSQVR